VPSRCEKFNHIFISIIQSFQLLRNHSCYEPSLIILFFILTYHTTFGHASRYIPLTCHLQSVTRLWSHVTCNLSRVSHAYHTQSVTRLTRISHILQSHVNTQSVTRLWSTCQHRSQSRVSGHMSTRNLSHVSHAHLYISYEIFIPFFTPIILSIIQIPLILLFSLYTSLFIPGKPRFPAPFLFPIYYTSSAHFTIYDQSHVIIRSIMQIQLLFKKIDSFFFSIFIFQRSLVYDIRLNILTQHGYLLHLL